MEFEKTLKLGQKHCESKQWKNWPDAKKSKASSSAETNNLEEL